MSIRLVLNILSAFQVLPQIASSKREGRGFSVYFDNDEEGWAPKDARRLEEAMGLERRGPAHRRKRLLTPSERQLTA